MWFNDIDIELRLGTGRRPAASRHDLARQRYRARMRACRLAERRADAGRLPGALGARTTHALRRGVDWIAAVLRLALPKRPA